MSRPEYLIGKYEAVVTCPYHQSVVLTTDEYHEQLLEPDTFWKCPICGATAEWDDSNYDAWTDNQPRTIPCEFCNGTGVVTCKRCNGTGWVGDLTGEICCGGTDDCPGCNGAGGVWVRQEM